MCNSDRRHFLAMSLVTVGAVCIGGAALAAETPAKKVYVCPPCGCAADGKEFAEPGTCPECGMPLVEKKPDAAAPPPKAGAPGGALVAKQTRAPPHSVQEGPARTGKRSDAPWPWGGFLS
jgi:hypothetical protein